MLSVTPLGDQAVLAYFADENAAACFAAAMRSRSDSWLVDVVQAYKSVAVYFDLDRTTFAAVRGQLPAATDTDAAPPEGKLHVVPCCYELGPDLARVAEKTGLTPEAVIALHTGQEYTVYAIGFCPGFPYLGYLPESLCGVPRLETPRLRVEAGSVGLTGRQTGIYTEARPAGWNLVGRTPLELVHVADGYFPLATGDRVRFAPIAAAEFQRRQGERL